MDGSSHGVVETQPHNLPEENHGILIKTAGSLTDALKHTPLI